MRASIDCGRCGCDIFRCSTCEALQDPIEISQWDALSALVAQCEASGCDVRTIEYTDWKLTLERKTI